MRPVSESKGEAHRASPKPYGASSKLEAVASAIALAGGAVSALLILVVLAVTAVSVFNRYILGSPMSGVDEATGFLVVATVMFGAAEALRSGDHIRIDLVVENVSARIRWLFDLWAHVAVLVFSVLLFQTGWHTVAFSRQFGAYSAGYLELPMWIPQATMPLGAALLALVALAKIVRLIAAGGRE